MSRLQGRLDSIERRLGGGDGDRGPVPLFVIRTGQELPDWAAEAITPHLYGGIDIVEWHDGPNGELLAAVTIPGGRGAMAWYRVTPDGCQPVPEPITATYTMPGREEGG